MKYTAGGVNPTLGQTYTVEVPIKGDPAAAQPAGPVAKESGDDIMVDPPVRNLPQYDRRWGKTRIAGPKDAKMLDWQGNGCNASTAAMILRWFAEDCPAGKLPFPTKPGAKIDPSLYSPLMGEAFWPNADPPGKIALDSGGRIDFGWVYAACATWLKSGGTLPRSPKGDVAERGSLPGKATVVNSEPSGGWLDLLRKMLKTGPVIVGLGAPAGHFVICHGIIGGALAIVDPGGVLYMSKAGTGGSEGIQNWSAMGGYADAGSGADKVRMPPASQWKEGKPPGDEGDTRSYNLISGKFLELVLHNLISLTSLTYPEGAKLGGAPSGDGPAQGAQPSGGQPAADKPPADQPTDAIKKPDDPRLSDKRKKLLAEVDKRMPSAEGDPPADGKTNLFDGVAHQVVGTSCGLLPGVVMARCGVKGPITACGTEGVMSEAKKMGIWVESDGVKLPMPGDIYVLRYPDKAEEDSVAHIGIIYEIDRNDPTLGMIWVTADSGQGTKEKQEAHHVNRQMKKVDGTHPFLSGPTNTPGDSPFLRRIGGWVDVDKLIP